MSKEFAPDQKEQVKRRETPVSAQAKERPAGTAPPGAAILRLQGLAGNRAVQRLLGLRHEAVLQRQPPEEEEIQTKGLAQRQGGAEGFQLDDETAGRINRARGGGQPLERSLQTQMGQTMGYDFSGVRVHSGPESDSLNRQLSARAFTTGQDIFLRPGEYNPASSGGRELIAHELSHVVQQGTGRVPGSGSGMTVRPAGDAFEQEADALARQAATAGPAAAAPPGGEGLQRQEEEEQELQLMSLQRQDEEEIEEPI